MDLTSALQKGLFEEEAHHNLDAAAAGLSIRQRTILDKDRKLAAHRPLPSRAKVYRKQGKTNEAYSAIRNASCASFSDQQTNFHDLDAGSIWPGWARERKEASVSAPASRAPRGWSRSDLLEEENQFGHG
jgi:hypothetical protein